MDGLVDAVPFAADGPPDYVELGGVDDGVDAGDFGQRGSLEFDHLKYLHVGLEI